MLFVAECLRVSIAVMKHHEKSNVGRKGLIQLTLSHHSSASKEVRTGTKAGQELGDRSQ